jgi:hypothetical protein
MDEDAFEKIESQLRAVLGSISDILRKLDKDDPVEGDVKSIVNNLRCIQSNVLKCCDDSHMHDDHRT